MIHLVYRSYGGENDKDRPSFYSKDLALASFIQASERISADVIFLNDGPVPRHRRELMESAGEVVHIAQEPVGMRKSYLAALDLPERRQWPDDHIVYFSEDDYLHLPDAFRALSNAAAAIPWATYFALYGSTPLHANSAEFPEGLTLPADWPSPPDATVDGHSWVNIPSTASTFGGRVWAIKDDRPIFRQCMFPFQRRFLDHETCLLYQGQQPYRGITLLTGLEHYPSSAWGRIRRYGLTPIRVALNVRARSRSARPHWLYAADPNYACHMSNGVMTPGRDWSRAAAAVRANPRFDEFFHPRDA